MDAIKETTGRIHSVETFGALDGPGVRYVVFFQGCRLRCAYCHNPDTWDAADGRVVTASSLARDILRYRNFIRTGGVTLSGGEPLLQPEFCTALLRLCKENGLHTAVDTSGSIPLSECREAVELADLLLLDIKALDPALCKNLTGMDNTNALALLNDCERKGRPVWIRHVLVPGVTLEPERLKKLADFLSGFSCVEKVELLPFHKMGMYKWDGMRVPCPLRDTPEPTQEEIATARSIFESNSIRL